ncbi:MAG TPA: hypothetical protein VFF90_14405, partial [Saprospiraceae bacterium]|nr:hypothetical protein [Saprospiraceae bacterium]
MKTQPFILRWLYCSLALTCFPAMSHAVEFAQTDWSVSYSQCDGYVQIEILFYNDHDGFGTIPDWMQKLDVYYLSGTTEHHILKWRHEDETCTGCQYSHTHEGETWNYLLYEDNPITTWTSVSVPNTEDEQKKMRIRFYNIPDDQIGTTVTIRIDGLWHGGGAGDGDVVFDNWDKTVDVPAIGNPSALAASVDVYCDYVHLTWTNPQNNPCPNDDWEVQVYRDGSYLGSGGQSGAYNDLTAVKGVDYHYKVRTLFEPNAYMNDYSDFTDPEVLGRRLGALPPPTNVTATNDRCDGKILVQWTWTNSGTPSSYIIQRKLVSGASYTALDTVAGNVSQFLDAMIIPDSQYLYQVKTINICGDVSSASAATNPPGRAAGAPAAPTNVTAMPGNASLIVSWTDNSNTETGFIL